jgi:putative DNA primase/helicase
MSYDDMLKRLQRVSPSGHGHVALCPSHDDRRRSLSLTQTEDRILIKCWAGCIIDDICGALGIRVRDLFTTGGRASAGWSNSQRLEYAERIWRKATKPAGGTAVERYLRNRGITLPIPPAIRFCTLTWEEEGWPLSMNWPALAAGVQDVDGNFTGVSITGLCADGSAKMPVESPRRIYGPYRGGAVRLSSQLSSQLAIGEGIETMLSVLQAADIPSWAALSASNLPYAQIPPCISDVIICSDLDPTGAIAAQRLAERLVREGRLVRIARPPAGCKDFNDVLMRG